MLATLLHFTDRLIPLELHAQEDMLYKGRFFVIVSLLSILSNFFSCIVIYSGLVRVPVDYFLLFSVLTSIVPMLVLWKTRKIVIATNVLVLIAFVSLFFYISNSGQGIACPHISWLNVFPLFVLLMSDLRSSIIWSIGLFLYYIWLYYYSVANNITALLSKGSFGLEEYLSNNIFLLTFVSIAVYGFQAVQKSHVKSLQIQRAALKQNNEMLKQKTDALNSAKNTLNQFNKRLEIQNRKLDDARQKMLASNQTLSSQNHQLNETRKALLDSNEALDRYAHTVSHDLKEPLRSISSFTKLLYDYYDEQNLVDQNRKEYFEFVMSGTDHMNRLISEMLKFSELSHNNQSDYKKVDLNQVIQIVEHNLNEQIKESKVKINYHNLPTVDAFPIPLIQVFQNLISNAIKFRRKDVAAHIDITAKESEKHYLIVIEDNGIGIKKDACDKIFKEFSKAHKNCEIEGHGIGLSTCQRVVKQHNGEIWVESIFGIGTSFYFTLEKVSGKKVSSTSETPQIIQSISRKVVA